MVCICMLMAYLLLWLRSKYRTLDLCQGVVVRGWTTTPWQNKQTTKQTKAINNSYIYIYHVNVTQTVPDISPLMPMHQDPLLGCIIGQNLEILTSTGGEWSWGQAKNCVNFDFQVKFDLEGQGQSTPKTIGILTKLFCMSGSNLVILAGTSDKLSRGQARDWRPHGQTQATTIPEGQNWPRVTKRRKWIRDAKFAKK